MNSPARSGAQTGAYRLRVRLEVAALTLASALIVFALQCRDLSSVFAFLQDIHSSACSVFDCHLLLWQDSLWCPLFFALLAVSVTLGLPASRPAARVLVAAVAVTLGLRYVLWRVLHTIDTSSCLTFALQGLCLFVEIMLFVNTTLVFLQALLPTDRKRESEQLSAAVREGTFMPAVDVLIPTYNEPVHLLRRTVVACQAMEYANKQVFLLDDMNRFEVRELAENLGCHYLAREQNLGAKAGNLNNALKSCAGGELLAVFDADFVPGSHFLEATVGFFQDKDLALLQTPQVFYNPDPVQRNLGLSADVTHEEDLFFRLVQPGRDRYNACICHGTSFLVRRSAIDEIGGFPQESVTEDFFTSIKLQARGYKTKYLNEALSAGASAADVDSFVQQRLRWAQGTIQVLSSPTNPLTVPGLSLMQRIMNFSGVVHWFCGVGNLVLLSIPVAFLLFDISPMKAQAPEVIHFWLPYYAFQVLAYAWFNLQHRSFFFSDVYGPVLSVPLLFAVAKTLVKPFGAGFKVTSKDQSRSAVRVSGRLLAPIAGILCLYLAGFMRYCLEGPWLNSDADSALIVLAWSLYNVILLVIAAQACVNIPERRQSIHFSLVTPAELIDETGATRVRLVNLSEGGALLELPGEYGSRTGLLNLPETNIGGIKFRIVSRRKEKLAGVEFLELSDEQHRRLIEVLYCRPGQWQPKTVGEVKGAWSLVRSVLRFYPLIEGRS